MIYPETFNSLSQWHDYNRRFVPVISTDRNSKWWMCSEIGLLAISWREKKASVSQQRTDRNYLLAELSAMPLMCEPISKSDKITPGHLLRNVYFYRNFGHGEGTRCDWMCVGMVDGSRRGCSSPMLNVIHMSKLTSKPPPLRHVPTK